MNGGCTDQRFQDAELAAYRALLQSRAEAARVLAEEISSIEDRYKLKLSHINRDYLLDLNNCGNNSICTEKAKNDNDKWLGMAQVDHDGALYIAQGKELTANEQAQQNYESAVKEAREKFCKGWSGTVSYTVLGKTSRDTSGVLGVGTVTWTENTTVEVSGHGKLQMAEDRPGSMLVIGGSGDWTDSFVRTHHVIRTVEFANGTSCVYDTTDTGQTLLKGMADQLTTSPSFIVTGNAYKIQVPSLGGMLSGTSTSSLTGTVSGPCGPPLTHSSTSPTGGSIPVHDLEIDGAIDPNTPNAIKGSKETPVSESANRDYVYKITWEFNR